MCSRYYLEMSSGVSHYIEAATKSPLRKEMASKLAHPFVFSGEVHPSDIVPVIAPRPNGSRAVFPMLWGYTIPAISRLIINARSETAKESRAFSEDWKRHRCVIVSSYYFEWEHVLVNGREKTGDKYAVQTAGQTVTYMAGLYHLEETRGLKYPAFAILTKEPTENLRKLHARMPVILSESQINDWINPDCAPEGIVQNSVTALIAEKASIDKELSIPKTLE